MSSFDQQIAFKLGDSIQDLHCHAAGRAGQIDATKSEAMNSNASIGQCFNGCAHIHRIPTKAVEFRHDQHVAFLHSKE
ncbi:Uncharacterised protein [Burkholderia pseudomallei]|nr:Uncharacterised protein [Burkholderia pseudomallei]CAJ3341209.1 Uncharacterised protein [Burkholderia pseudomallei]CAJ4092178.1 Uncharacterised protein [Burkholderia pseudomallei]CAJ4663494.1 Uncharacterised protein [Burkholderia pseudomallei]CAJ4998631.1 Uncharacterised protein [Burkholderia pseudomallei]